MVNDFVPHQAFREERLLPPMLPSSHGLNGLQTRQESPPQPQPQPQPQTQTQTQTQQHQQQETAQQSMTSMLKRHDAHLKMIAEQLETVIDWVHRRQVRLRPRPPRWPLKAMTLDCI